MRYQISDIPDRSVLRIQSLVSSREERTTELHSEAGVELMTDIGSGQCSTVATH